MQFKNHLWKTAMFWEYCYWKNLNEKKATLDAENTAIKKLNDVATPGAENTANQWTK